MAELLAANQITIAKVLDGEKGIQGEKGADGKSSYFHIKYSSVANPTSSSQITETPSTYIGTYVDFTEADSTDPSTYTWSRFEGIQGEKGEQGIPGIGQDGRTSYLHIAYATSADGSEGFSISESANKTYIGQYTDFVSTDSTDYTKYAWTKIKGEIGADGYSPTVTTGTSSDGSTTVTVTNKDGSTTTTLVDGKARADINNLDIVGINLLLNSGFKNNADEWFTYGITDYIVKDGKQCAHMNFSVFKVTNFVRQSILGKLEPDTQYTMSGWVLTENVVKGTTNFACMFFHDGHYDNNGSSKWYSYGSKNLPINAGEWTHVEWTFTTDSIKLSSSTVSDIYLYARDMTGDIYFCDLKLEKGNKATDWTPAPEDVDAGIKDAAKVATNFIGYDSTNGLVLGNKESGSWVGYRTQIDNDSFNVLDENGNIIASYGSNEVELGKGNPNAIIKMCDGKAYVKNYIVGSQNTSVFCGQDVTVVGEWEGASEAYALFKQGFINIGQASSHIKLSNENGNMNQVEIQGQNITINGELALGTALSIANGGTGAKTAAAARTNLGVKKYTTKTFTSSSQSVSASTYKNIDFSISLAGYKPIGIMGIDHGVYELAIIKFTCGTDSASVVLRNVTSKAKTVSVAITVLYEEV